MVGQFFIIRALGFSLMDTSPPMSYIPCPLRNAYSPPWPYCFFLLLLSFVPSSTSSFSFPLFLFFLFLHFYFFFLILLFFHVFSFSSCSSSFLLFLFLLFVFFFFLFLLFLFFLLSSSFLSSCSPSFSFSSSSFSSSSFSSSSSFLSSCSPSFSFFLLRPALSLLLLLLLIFILPPPPLLLLPLSSLLLFYSSFPLLPLPPPLNIFYLNLSCEYSFCFVLLNFTCLSVAVCLSMFLLIKLLYKHIIMNCITQTQHPDPTGVQYSACDCDHRVPRPGTRMKNGTRLCPRQYPWAHGGKSQYTQEHYQTVQICLTKPILMIICVNNYRMQKRVKL